jgi:hypothetical protein
MKQETFASRLIGPSEMVPAKRAGMAFEYPMKSISVFTPG